MTFVGGVLSGTPTATASGSITFRATNAFGFADRPLTLTVNAASSGPARITSATIPNGTVGTPYSFVVARTGTEPITWSIQDGVLPTGLSLNTSTGEVYGTPSVGSKTQFILRADNGISGASNEEYCHGYMVAVTPYVQPPYVIQNAAFPAHVSVPYSQTFTATGDSPITWSYTGTLPSGLNFNASTATISGTPTTAGNSAISITATNSGGTSTKNITLAVSASYADRIYSNNLTYDGAFRLPRSVGGGPTFAPNKPVTLSINKNNTSECYLGIPADNNYPAAGWAVRKISIPAIVNSTNKSNLNTASYLDATSFDLSEGAGDAFYQSYTVGPDTIYNDTSKIYVTFSYFYGTTNGSPAIFSRSNSLVTDGSVIGLTAPGIKINSASRYYNGGMDGASAYAVSQGVPAIVTGGGFGSIQSNIPAGQSAYAFDSTAISSGATNITSGKLLFTATPNSLPSNYSLTINDQNPWFAQGTSNIRGLCWANGKKTVLYIGTHGLGEPWYGYISSGGAFMDNPINLVVNTTGIVGDGDSGTKGDHAPPYYPYVWAYYEQDMIDVANGTKTANSLTPYSVWPLNIPSVYFDTQRPYVGGLVCSATHDSVNKKIYVAIRAGDQLNQFDNIPMIHVFSYP